MNRNYIAQQSKFISPTCCLNMAVESVCSRRRHWNRHLCKPWPGVVFSLASTVSDLRELEWSESRLLLISCSQTETYPSLHHVFRMTCHLNSARLFTSIIFITNHKLSSASGSSIHQPFWFPLKIKCHLFKISHPGSSDPSSSHSRSERHPTLTATLSPLTLWKSDVSLLWTTFWLIAALVNKLVPCVCFFSGTWEVWRLQLRSVLIQK